MSLAQLTLFCWFLSLSLYLSYLSMRPTNARMWHKAIFKVGPVAGPKPTHVQQGQNTFNPVGIPLFGAPGNKPNPTEGGKSLGGDGPLRLEKLSSAEAHPAEPPRGKTAYRMQPNNWRGKVTNTLKKSGDLSISLSL